ncbi:MAG: pyrroloquinoline quinone biosynthesis peptide chaperone PqqD [Gammaproteobacteria bacterium]|nr:pyrroloquinoline quinone biosynthesis peptide chaperone PqqD [Gammaproteobacteria bacterium]
MANTFNAEDIPVITPTFRLQWEQVQDCYVILYPEGMVKLSASAGEIMKRCDGVMNISNMINDLHKQFPGADLENDVYKFLEVAHANGWIRTKQAV